MKNNSPNRRWPAILIIISFLALIFIALPLFFLVFSNDSFGNVALIPINSVITTNGGSYLGTSTVSSTDLVSFIEEADKNPSVQVIVLEISSPGGSAVASDEIALAVKKANKPIISQIREVGASGGYWIASASDYIIANRMSMTGSIGVTSSYLEFSGLMEKYGVGYEQIIAGEYKDMGTPFRQATPEERAKFDQLLDKIYDIFVKEVAQNRNLPESEVRRLATGEVFIGIDALELGLVDMLGNKDVLEQHLKETYSLKDITYVRYEVKPSFFDILAGVFNDFSFSIGQGLGSWFTQQAVQDDEIMLLK
jgi:protease-4